MGKQPYSTSAKHQGRLKGVFSLEETRKTAPGPAERDVRNKTYWFCQELEDGGYEVQPLGPHHTPTGPVKTIRRDNFLKRFMPEPAMYFSLVYPSMKELELTIARGDRYRNIKKYDRAETEYNKALWIDEENIRATFGLALTYLGMDETEKASRIFERLVVLDEAFQPLHKHLFNEFGIKLRKSGLYSQAITYYSRALELTEDDENLFFNLARVHFECNDPLASLNYTMKAVELNPELEPAVKLLRWILLKKLVPAKEREKAAPLLSLTTSSPFLEEELDSFLEEELKSFLDDHEDALLLTETCAFEAEEPAPERADAGMAKRASQLEDALAGKLESPAQRTGTRAALQAISEPQQPETAALHRRRRMNAIRAVRKSHKK